MLGRIVGEYRILGLIGQGGMGTVYEVESLKRPLRAALKVLRPDQLGKTESISRFEREGRVLASIRHPNICHVYDVGRLGDESPYLVMEKLEGETLARRIERTGKGLPWEEVTAILLQALEALDAAHSRNVIHRDFKPENIFISADAARGVKVLDFGISKQTGMEDAQANLTRTGMVMGTPYYMAPEQAMGDRNLDRRVDVWAAGVVLYEALAGTRPFLAKNYNALLVQILTTHPKPIDEVVSGLPKGMPGVLGRALEKKRDARFLSVRELGDALRAIQRSNDRGLHVGRAVTGPALPLRPPVQQAAFPVNSARAPGANTVQPASPSGPDPRHRVGRGTQVMNPAPKVAPVAMRGRTLSDKAPASMGRPLLAAPETLDEEDSVALTLHHRRGRPPTLDLRPRELMGPESSTVLRPHGHPIPREIEDEPTTVLLREDSEETPTVDDDDATQVDPPQFFDIETTGSRRR
ncbi:MAG: protein kinase [Polyangiaceae bacterium]